MGLRTGSASLQNKQYRKLIVRLVEARKKANITQREMGAQLDLPQNAISRIENYDRRLDALEFLIWCKVCHIQPDVKWV